MKNRTNIKTALLQSTLIVAILLGISSCNDNTQTEDTAKAAEEYNEAKFDDNKQENDAQFLVEATAINLEEIRLGQLAQEISRDADIIALGKMMADAHSRSLIDVTALAEFKLVTIPTELTNDAVQLYKQLNQKSTNDFDKTYCEKMVEGHKGAIAKFEKEIADTHDGDIKEWATATLPELRKHLDHAIACQKKCEEN